MIVMCIMCQSYKIFIWKQYKTFYPYKTCRMWLLSIAFQVFFFFFFFFWSNEALYFTEKHNIEFAFQVWDETCTNQEGDSYKAFKLQVE
jgi:hypothetical protein